MSPKSMRSVEELISAYHNKEPLTLEEERLVDRHLFEKTGKRTKRFKKTVTKKSKGLIVRKSELLEAPTLSLERPVTRTESVS